MIPFGENSMPQASRPQPKDKNYGRQIPEVQPEENIAETGQDQQREPEEKRRRRRPVRRRQEKMNGRRLLPLPMRKSGGADLLHSFVRAPETPAGEPLTPALPVCGKPFL